jgi:hypothetical protein
METSLKGYIMVLTNEGEFMKVPWSRKSLPSVGKEVEFVQPVTNKVFSQNRALIPLVASIALILLLIPIWHGIFLPETQMVVAYINVDINPSLELGINKKGNVVEVRGLNDDGEKLLQNLELISIPIKEAMEILTTAAIQEKYLTSYKGNNVLITVSGDEKMTSKVRNLENEVKRVLNENNISAEADTLEVSEEIHKKAREENISTGKYVLYMEAVEEGLDVSLDDLRGDSIINVVKEAGGVPGQLISKVKADKNRIQEIHQRNEERKNISKEQKGKQKQKSANFDDNKANGNNTDGKEQEQEQEAGQQKNDVLKESEDIDRKKGLDDKGERMGRRNR